MSKKLKNDEKHLDMKVAQLAEELELLELIYKRKSHNAATVNEVYNDNKTNSNRTKY